MTVISRSGPCAVPLAVAAASQAVHQILPALAAAGTALASGDVGRAARVLAALQIDSDQTEQKLQRGLAPAWPRPFSSSSALRLRMPASPPCSMYLRPLRRLPSSRSFHSQSRAFSTSGRAPGSSARVGHHRLLHLAHIQVGEACRAVDDLAQASVADRRQGPGPGDAVAQV